MADLVSATITGTDTLALRFSGSKLPGAVAVTMEEQTAILETRVKERMAALFRNPSRMQEAVDRSVTVSEAGAEGVVFAEGLPYLRIHEYGGVTRPHQIFPVNAKALAFLTPASFGFSGHAASAMVFAKRVNHPGSRVPERSYMRSALAQRRTAIVAAFRSAILGAI